MEISEDTDPLIGKIGDIFPAAGRGKSYRTMPIRPAGMDKMNLFPGNASVNAELAPGFATFSKLQSTCKYSGNEIADLPCVFVQRECEARQIDFAHARKFHNQIQPAGLTGEIDLPGLVVSIAQIAHPA